MWWSQKWWERDPEHVTCDACGKDFPLKKIYKFTWRYQSKVKRYRGSGRAFIMTGYKVLCHDCLKKITK